MPRLLETPDGTIDALRQAVAREAGASPGAVRLVRSPYRICPLGAHIDHQLGPVTAMALDRALLLAYVPSASRQVSVGSLDFPGRVRFHLDDIPAPAADDWGNYARGAAAALRARHRLERGIVAMTAGRLHGGGVSSSAAVGVAYLLALEAANGLALDAEENIELDRRIENDYLGLRNGILDQAAILLSRRGHLTRIDCRTGRHERIPAPAGSPPFRILLAFSGLSRGLMGTDYNRRVDECAEAARVLLDAAGRPDAPPLLGNVRADEYEAHARRLGRLAARRAAHFFGEVERVRQGVEAWARGDIARFGALMTASGESSVANYECGSPPLIDLFRSLVARDGVHGARFSGAGFRGCCVALIDPDAVDDVIQRVADDYTRRHPELAARGAFAVCETGDGAAILDIGDAAEPLPRAS
jgi:galacturonokinase